MKDQTFSAGGSASYGVRLLSLAIVRHGSFNSIASRESVKTTPFARVSRQRSDAFSITVAQPIALTV